MDGRQVHGGLQEGAALEALLAGLRAVAEPSRLRLLAVCAKGEWTVSELVGILGQSQPRISRHLKVLAEAGLLERFREGSWVFYRRAQAGDGARIARSLGRLLPDDDPLLAADARRLAAVREARRREAERFFDKSAATWDGEGALALPNDRVLAEIRRLVAERRPSGFLDIGTGTGRVLGAVAGFVGTGLGLDVSHDMLKVARANLDRAEARNCHVRQGDMYQLPLADRSFAAVALHQVLHFADDPEAALAEAARVLAPGGCLIVADLAAHAHEWLRAERAHRRLGFGEDEMRCWIEGLGLDPLAPVRVEGEGIDVVVWTALAAPTAISFEKERAA